MNLTAERCVHSRAVGASCRACVDACPTRAITLDGHLRVDVAACVDCGACGAACPTAAFAPAEAEPRPMLRCGDGVPCVAALSVEALLAAASRGLILLVGASDCPAHAAHAQAAARVDVVRGLIDTPLAWDEEPAAAPKPPWRLVAPAPIAVDRAKLDPRIVRDRATPSARAYTRATLAGRTDAVPAAAAPFTSAKALDAATCIGCLRCLLVCPTGALALSGEAVRFDPGACVACGLCHDVCLPGALTRAPTVDLSLRPVAIGRLRACGECGARYALIDDDTPCPTCAALDAEARDLLGFK